MVVMCMQHTAFLQYNLKVIPFLKLPFKPVGLKEYRGIDKDTFSDALITFFLSRRS